MIIIIMIIIVMIIIIVIMLPIDVTLVGILQDVKPDEAKA